MGLFFEWDNSKAESNIIKHKVSFEEASTIFADFRSLTINDPGHSIREKDILPSDNRLLSVY